MAAQQKKVLVVSGMCPSELVLTCNDLPCVVGFGFGIIFCGGFGFLGMFFYCCCWCREGLLESRCSKLMTLIHFDMGGEKRKETLIRELDLVLLCWHLCHVGDRFNKLGCSKCWYSSIGDLMFGSLLDANFKMLLSLDGVDVGVVWRGNFHSFVFSSCSPCMMMLILKQIYHLVES